MGCSTMVWVCDKRVLSLESFVEVCRREDVLEE